MKIGRINFWKRKNIKGFSFFVVAAFLFLVLTKLSETYTQEIDIKIDIDGLEEEVRIIGDSTITITALVKGRGFYFVPFTFKNPDALILEATKDLKRNNNTLSWDVFNNANLLDKSLGKNLEVLSVNPDTLIVNYDKLASKTVPLHLNIDVSFSPGYDFLRPIESEVDSVKLVGLSDVLNSIDSIETEKLAIKNQSTNFERTLDVVLPDGFDLEVVPSSIDVKGEVGRFTEGEVKVPVVLENVPQDIRINFFPKEVDLLYYVSLDNFSTIEKKDFKVICDYAQLNETDQQFLTPIVIEKPEAVKRTRLRQRRIEFIILE